MPYRTSEDLWSPLALLVGGMLTPAILLGLAEDLLTLYASAVELTLLVAVGYGLLAWRSIDRGSLDATSFLLVSLIFPWLLMVGVVFVVLLLNQGEAVATGPIADLFRRLTTDWPGSIFGYAAVYVGAGIGTFLLSRRYRTWADRDARLPPASRLIAAVVAVVVLLGLGLGAANAIAAGDATVAAVGPGTAPYQDPTFNVTVAGPATELRVTVTAPTGASVTTRLARSDMRGGTGTAAIPLDYHGSFGPDELPVRDGTYRVRVTSLAGLPVASATFDAGDAVAARLSGVATTNGTLPWTAPPPVVYSRGTGDTQLGLAIENRGAFHAELSLLVRVPGDEIHVDRVFLAPGERGGVVLALSPDTARAVRDRGDGTVRVELYSSATAEEPEAVIDVALPAASA